MLTLNQVVKNLNNIADSHLQLNHFFYGEIYDFASSGVVDYPALIVTQEPNVLSEKVLTMSFNLYVADLVHKDIKDRVEVLSDTQSILIDVVAILKRTTGYEWAVNLNNIVLNDFVDKFDEEVSGWWLKLNLRIPNPLNRCAVPVSGTPAIVAPAPEGGGTDWILAGGLWDDGGTWIDAEVWID